MSKKRKPDTPPEPSPADAAALAIVESTREQNVKPPKTSIYRVDPESGDRKFVARVTTDLATEENVQRRYGAGKYFLNHQIASESGSYVFHSSDTFTVDAPEELPEDQPAAGASSPAVPTPVGGDVIGRAMEAGVIQLLEHSARQNELTIAIVKRLTEEPAHRGPTIVELLTAAAPIVTAFLENRPKQKDPLDTAAALATLLAKRDNGGEQMAAMFERGISLATKFGAGGGGDGGMMPVVGEGIKVLGSIIDTIVAERRVARGGPVVTVGPDGQPAPSAPPALSLVPDDTAPMATATPPSSSDRLWISVARAQLPLLLSAARFMPAPAAADTIAANLSPAAFDDLLNDIQDQTAPGFAARLAGIFPQVENLSPEWFGELVSTLLEIGAGDDELEPEPAPAAKPKKGARK